MDNKNLDLDGHSAYRSGEVKENVKSEKVQIQIYFLLSYLPEVNPEVLGWRSLQCKIRKSSFAGPNDLADKIFSHTPLLQISRTRFNAFL